MKPREFLSSEQAAEQLGFGQNLNAFHQWVKRAKKLPVNPLKVYKLGRRLRFDKRDVASRIEVR